MEKIKKGVITIIKEAKSKGEKERYNHLNAEFQIARRDEKAFLSDQCKEIEENNRMGKTRDPFKKRDPQESSPTPQFKSINSSALSLLHSPTLTSIHDHWKNHSLG